MKNILVIGSTGQIGSELTMKLRNMYPEGTVVAGYIKGSEPKGILLESGPAEEADVCNGPELENIVKKYNIDTILMNILEIARNNNVAVFTPSSIGSFGPETPHENTPQDTIQRPRSMYGCTKVATELLSDYYHNKYGVDTRSVRFPGLISNVTLPGGGTTDYAVEIYYAAVKGEEFVCPIAAGTFMDMMYMPDALKAAVDIMNADPSKLKHRNSFNIASMSFDPEIINHKIQEHIPGFKMRYEVDPVRQAIADSWPDKMDDSCAREEWGWQPSYDLETMTVDMIAALKKKLL